MNDKQIKKDILRGMFYARKYRNLSYDNLGRHFKVARYTVEQVSRGYESTLVTSENLTLMRALIARKEYYGELAAGLSMKKLAKKYRKGYRSLKRISGQEVREPASIPKRQEPTTTGPIARFLAMQLSRNPGVVSGYY